MLEAESLEETLAFLDEALRGSDLVLNDDPQLFASMGDEIDQELTLLTPPSNESTGHTTQKGKRKKSYNQNKAREERHGEIVKLRDEVEDLEFTLKRLQTIRGKRGSGRSRHAEEKSVWKDACTRQLERRLRVERENMHLIRRVEKDKQLIKRMERLLDVRPALWNMVYPDRRKLSKRIEIPAGALGEMADLIFGELTIGVESYYHEVESLDRAVSPILGRLPTCQPMFRGGSNGRRNEAYCYNDLPVSMTETGDSWWQHWNSYRGEAENANYVVKESFGLEISDVANNTSATFYVQQILRRHIEDHRVVFVWNGYIEPFLFKGRRIRGIYYREQSYVLIKPQPYESGVCSRASSCEMITPYFLEPNTSRDPTAAEVTKFLMGSMTSDFLTWSETAESLLLEHNFTKN